MFNQHGKLIRGPLAKPTSAGGLQAAGPAVDIAFENGLDGGRLFATDSNQATHAAGQNNSSRIVTVDTRTGLVTPFITNLPTGDHPSEQLAFRDGWIYWSQGSTTNSGVVGRDNGGGTNQQDIPCQDIKLSNNVFDSGGGVKTSGYSPFGTQRPGATVHAFETASHPGVCDGAILRARLNAATPDTTIEPYSWGYRNGYAIRFAPRHHALLGNLLVGEDGADERVPGRRSVHRKIFSSRYRIRTARQITMVGPINMDRCPRVPRYTIRLAAQATISACPTQPICQACARPPVLQASSTRMYR